ncbi:TonB-dependent receptor plug domain-containing protein [Pseudomonas sp.]|uniref:TonB-dependent siderophore receptor n=1 Tax=Pseudomonas sp. TaxID=306 RepID=UPI0028B2435F|nr:TonB-dependent receptor plug domain-containing protein [Pseudomonas sp.]
MSDFTPRYKRLSYAVALALPFLCAGAFAQESAPASDDTVKLDDYTVEESVEDNLGIMPSTGNTGSSVFGVGKPLVETPRSVTEVSSELIQNYGLRDVNDLVRMTPGAYTGSFFGVAGSVSLRGEEADNYFRGMKRVQNSGNYTTPIRAASSVDIVRGPVSPAFGAGKIGGYMNFTPKSAKSGTSKYIEEPTGEVGMTVGSYDKYITHAEGGTPFTLGGRQGGVYAYYEKEDSKSYYDYVEPKSQLGQLAFDLDLTDNLRAEFGGQYLDADREQNAGWNRVTQDLIDHGTYITGAASDLNSRGSVLYPDDVRDGIAPGVGFPSGSGNALLDVFCSGGYSGCSLPAVDNGSLSNPGTKKLDHNETMTTKADRGETTLRTAYFDLIRDLGDGWELKNQSFYEDMDHYKYSSYGFTAKFDSYVWEDKLSLSFPVTLGEVATNNSVGVNYRYYNGVDREAYGDEIFDRRDITVGATPNDTFDSGNEGNVSLGNGQYRRPFTSQNFSVSKNTGAFAVSDMNWRNWNLTLGYRFDYYDVKASEKALSTAGTLIGDADGDGNPDWFSDDGTADSFNISLAYKTPWGIVPYFTYAESSSLATNSAGGIPVENVQNGSWIQDSKLREAGIKYSNPSGTVYAALAAFDQDRSYQDAQSGTDILVNSKGFEGELRWLIDKHFSMSAAASKTHVKEKGNPYTILNTAAVAAAMGVDPATLYGYRFYDASGSILGGEWDRGGVPEWVTSLYGNYTQPLGIGELNASLGFTWVDAQWADNQKQIRLPSYTVWNGSVGYDYKNWSTLFTVNNLFDEEYFTSANLFDSVLVMPSEGRTFTASLNYKF